LTIFSLVFQITVAEAVVSSPKRQEEVVEMELWFQTAEVVRLSMRYWV
jgi:hypothetical protein